MEKNAADGLHRETTALIIGAAYEVHRHLGHGFLEKVYVVALLRELHARGIVAASEVPIPVIYKGEEVGRYFADILVNEDVICEIKAVRRLLPEHEAQLLHYLKATGKAVGLLLNFGTPSAQIKRMVFTPDSAKPQQESV